MHSDKGNNPFAVDCTSCGSWDPIFDGEVLRRVGRGKGPRCGAERGRVGVGFCEDDVVVVVCFVVVFCVCETIES